MQIICWFKKRSKLSVCHKHLHSVEEKALDLQASFSYADYKS